MRLFPEKLVICEGAVTIAVAAPLFEIALLRQGLYPLVFSEALLLVVLTLVALPALLFAARCAAGRWARSVDMTLYAIVIFTLCRISQRDLVERAPIAQKLFLIAGAASLLIWFARRFPQWTTSVLKTLAMLAPVISAYFLVQVLRQSDSLMRPIPGPRGPPVVVVVMDALSIYDIVGADMNLDPRILPNFSAFQKSSVWFRNTTAGHPYTGRSIPSFLSGRQDVSGMSNEPLLSVVPQKLAQAGYGLNIASPTFGCVFNAACRTRESSRFSFRTPIALVRTYLGYLIPSVLQPSFTPSIMLNAVDEEAGHSQSLFGTVAPGNFYLFHTMITHEPPLYDQDGNLHALPVALGGLHPPLNAAMRALINARTRYADRWLGGLMHSLLRRGLWDRSIVILVADHGYCLQSFCNRTEEDNIRQGTPRLAFVPFFLHAPGLKPRIYDAPAKLLDIVPTLWPLVPALRALRQPQSDGVNLLAAEPSAQRERAMSLIGHTPRDIFALPAALPRDPDTPYKLIPEL